MKRTVVLISVVMVMSSWVHLGTIRKREDPILKTQTDPITYQKKLEEMKDGPKGAPTPSFNLYPKARFMTDPPVGEVKEEPPSSVSDKEEVSEVSVSSDKESEDWWSDETSGASSNDSTEDPR